MADNFTANPGSGGSVFAADDIGSGVLATRVKPVWGADGTGNDVNATTPLPVQIVPGTEGCTTGRVTTASSTNATSAKGSAGVLYGFVIINTNAAARFFKFYNKASAPTVGSDTPLFTVGIPGTTTGGGVVVPLPNGIAFSTGIAWATTSAYGDADTGAITAGDLTGAIFYK